MTVAKVDDNLLCDEAVRDPHAYFARLRDEAVVQWNDRHRSWVVTGYADVVEGLRGNKLTAERIAPFAESILRSSDPAGPPSALAVLADWLVFKDPPDHTRLRKLVARAFTPGSVRVRGTEIQRTIDGLLDDLADREEADLIEHFALNPEEMREMPHRKFEELIAEIFSRFGYDVELTKQTRDGGTDISSAIRQLTAD